jgi:hypothetical protein
MSGLGEHVIYEIDVPISLKSQESSMVPIAKHSITGEKVLDYDPKVSEVNATSAVRIYRIS